jgi:hypothetical protein
MSPYAITNLDNLRNKRNRTPDETTLLITLLAQATADAVTVSPARKYALATGGEPASEPERAYLTALMRQRPPVPATRPADEFDDNDWEIRACHAHAF